MSEIDAGWAARHEAERNALDAKGLSMLDDERDSCGVGFIVAIDGKPRGYAPAGDHPRITAAKYEAGHWHVPDRGAG